MSQFVEVELVRPWMGRQKGDRIHVWPNAASLLGRLKVAAVVPTTVVADIAAEVPVRRQRGWPKGKPRRPRRDPL